MRAHRIVKATMLVTDLGFLGYWIATATGLISVGEDMLLKQWNWSFAGLDLLAIVLGLSSLALARTQARTAGPLMLISLVLTGAAGLMALNFYALRCEFDPAWWIPNGWLLTFPAVAVGLLLCRPEPPTGRVEDGAAPESAAG